MNEHPRIRSNWSLEAQMVRVYTKTKWLEFQEEISQSHGYYVHQTSVESDFQVLRCDILSRFFFVETKDAYA